MWVSDALNYDRLLHYFLSRKLYLSGYNKLQLLSETSQKLTNRCGNGIKRLRVEPFRSIRGVLRQSASLAAGEWRAAQAPVVKIRGVVEALQLTSHWNLPTQPVITHIQELQIECRHLRRNAPVDLVVVKIQRSQGLGERHLGQIELEQVSRQVHDLRGLARAEND